VASNQQFGDHIHPSAIIDGSLQRTIGFDYDEVDRNLSGVEPAEDMVSFSDASAAIAILLGAICDTRKTDHPINLVSVGAKAESLLFLLDPNQSRYESLSDIARAANMTRANLSKWLLKLKDEVGFFLSAGKRAFSRESYRSAQKAALAAGCHSSQRRRLSNS
jgi:hypothetical protein